jgi:hypothetical protein
MFMTRGTSFDNQQDTVRIYVNKEATEPRVPSS